MSICRKSIAEFYNEADADKFVAEHVTNFDSMFPTIDHLLQTNSQMVKVWRYGNKYLLTTRATLLSPAFKARTTSSVLSGSNVYNAYEIKPTPVIILSQNGNQVTVNVTDFPPFFYVKVADYWKDREKRLFEDYIRSKMPPTLKDCFIRTGFKKNYIFKGFNDKKSNFVRLVFKNMKAMRNVMYMFQNKNIVGAGFIINLPDLNGDKKLKERGITIHSLMDF